MSERSDDREWMMRISEAFAEGDYDFLSDEFGWDHLDEDEELSDEQMHALLKN